MPIYVALMHFNASGSLADQERYSRGLGALALARKVRGEELLDTTTGSGFYGAFWTRGEIDMVLMFSRQTEAQASEFARRLESELDAAILLLPTLTEGEKKRQVQN